MNGRITEDRQAIRKSRPHTLFVALVVACLVPACFQVPSEPPAFEGDGTGSGAIETSETDPSTSTDDTGSGTGTYGECVCTSEEPCCSDGCSFDTDVAPCDDGDRETFGDQCGGGLPCTGSVYCESHFCFGVGSTYQYHSFDDREVLIESVGPAGNPEGTDGCDTREWCGQDALYWSVNDNRVFTPPVTTTDPILRDSLTDLYWDKNFYRAPSYEAAVNICDSLNDAPIYGNYPGGWRLPTVWELTTIVSYDYYVPPAADTNVFPNTDIDSDSSAGDLPEPFYTSTPVVGGSANKWRVNFADGSTDNGAGALVRCVRDDAAEILLLPTSNPHRFAALDNDGDPTFYDRATQLEWQSVDIEDQLWSAALTACEGASTAGHLDWRLPDINELASLVAYDKSPAPQTDLPSMTAGYYWSSSTYKPSVDSLTPHNAWTVDFSNGKITPSDAPKTFILTFPACTVCGLGSTPSSACSPYPCTFGSCCKYPNIDAGEYPVRCVRGSGRQVTP